MIVKEIDRIRGNPNSIEAYRTGINALFQSGIVDAIRVLGRPRRIKGGENVHQMASEGSWASGWNDCLDTLLYFQELYLDSTNEVPNVKMDFGAIDRAVRSGDLTEEEADAIRNDKRVAYNTKSYTANIDNPKRPNT